MLGWEAKKDRQNIKGMNCLQTKFQNLVSETAKYIFQGHVN